MPNKVNIHKNLLDIMSVVVFEVSIDHSIAQTCLIKNINKNIKLNIISKRMISIKPGKIELQTIYQ